jgi:glyoxylase I family protein
MQLVQTAPPVVATPPLASLHHVGITVTDLDRSVTWYGEMLGMVQWMEETYPGGRTAGLMRPGTHVHVGLDAHDRNDGEDFSPHRTGLDHLCFGVASRAELDDWRAHLTARGVACSEIRDYTEPIPFSLFTFNDPDGVALELMYLAA